MFNPKRIKAGHVLRFDRSYLHYPVGARAVCITTVENAAMTAIAVIVCEDGRVHALTPDGITSLAAAWMGYLPQFEPNEPFAFRCYHLSAYAAAIPGAFDALLRQRRDTLLECVRCGATHLDVHRPRWWKRIDLTSLDCADQLRCVVGQLYPGPFYGELLNVFAAGSTIPPYDEAIAAARTHGFLLPLDADTEEFASLTALWRDEIWARLEAP